MWIPAVLNRLTLATATTVLVAVPVVRSRPAAVPQSPAPLQFKEYTADSMAYDVNSTLIYGPTEAILVDAQLRVSDAQHVADMIAASGKHLKAIFFTHSDDDHVEGAAVITARFPGTPVYMAPSSLAEFNAAEVPSFTQRKAMIRNPPPGRVVPPAMAAEMADSLVTPRVAPETLTVDGVEVDVVGGEQGDVLHPSNSYLWIPSQRAVIAGDIVFNGVHVWLAGSNEASRTAWRETIRRIVALHPLVVVAGHKSRVDAPDTPDILQQTDQYLIDFDSSRKASANAPELVAAMMAKYPDRKVPVILRAAARHAFSPGPG